MCKPIDSYIYETSQVTNLQSNFPKIIHNRIILIMNPKTYFITNQMSGLCQSLSDLHKILISYWLKNLFGLLTMFLCCLELGR